MKCRRAHAWALFALTLAPLIACAPPPKPLPFPISLEDATLIAAVKTAILNDPGIGALRIDVRAAQGVVTLSGTVRSREEETTAIELARKVQGVREVKSELRIP
jgi:hyperosmotically inducible protein